MVLWQGGERQTDTEKMKHMPRGEERRRRSGAIGALKNKTQKAYSSSDKAVHCSKCVILMM